MKAWCLQIKLTRHISADLLRFSISCMLMTMMVSTSLLLIKLTVTQVYILVKFRLFVWSARRLNAGVTWSLTQSQTFIGLPLQPENITICLSLFTSHVTHLKTNCLSREQMFCCCLSLIDIGFMFSFCWCHVSGLRSINWAKYVKFVLLQGPAGGKVKSSYSI